MSNLQSVVDYRGKWLWLLSLLLLGGTIYFLIEIDKLRSSDTLTQSDLLELIQIEETPQATTSATPQTDEVILPFMQKPVQITPIPTGSNDPMVRCQIHANCGGGIVGLPKNACENATCCQLGQQWLFYTNKAKCEADQQAYAQKLKQLQQAQQQQQQTQPVATDSSN